MCIRDSDKHELAQSALVGRASAYRQSGEPDKAILDVRSFLKTEPEGKVKIDAMYEMGLAQIDKKDWPNVAVTFNELLKADGDSNLADQFHYELAWANRSLKQDEKALPHFGSIASKFPASKHAAEANFHLAQHQYGQDKFQDALPLYQKSCLLYTSPSPRDRTRSRMPSSA